MINSFKKSDKRKVQLTMKPKFMSSADSNEKHTIHTKDDNIKIMISDSESFENIVILFWKNIKKV